MLSAAEVMLGLLGSPPPARESWRGVALETRVIFLSEGFVVPHPDRGKVRGAIKRLRAEAALTRRCTMLMVLCPSGWGKTDFCDLLVKQNPRRNLNDRAQVSVVKMNVPLAPSPLSMGRAALDALGHGGGSGGADELIKDLIYFLNVCGTECLLIDNVQDIVRKRGVQGLLDVAAWIRMLSDAFAGLIVMFGAGAAEAIVDLAPELRRRSPAKLRFDYLSMANEKEIARTKRFLHEIDLRLPLAEYSNLSRFAEQIMLGSFGIQDYIFKLIRSATRFAVEGGRESIALSDLAGAFETTFIDAGKGVNPFVEGGPRRPLDQPGEPFHDWDLASSLPVRRLATSTKRLGSS